MDLETFKKSNNKKIFSQEVQAFNIEWLKSYRDRVRKRKSEIHKDFKDNPMMTFSYDAIFKRYVWKSIFFTCHKNERIDRSIRDTTAYLKNAGI